MSNWKVYRIGYSYASDPEKMGLRIANFTVKARTIDEAERKATPLMSGRGVAWRILND